MNRALLGLLLCMLMVTGIFCVTSEKQFASEGEMAPTHEELTAERDTTPETIWEGHLGLHYVEPTLLDPEAVPRIIYNKEGIDSLIAVQVRVDTLGNPRDVTIHRSLNPHYDSLAANIVKQYRFSPAKIYETGRVMERLMTIIIRVKAEANDD